MRQIIASVPHTGTRFLMERLDIAVHVHTNWDWQRIIAGLTPLKGRPPIVPLRNPSDVWQSWCRRNDPSAFPYGDFFMAWGCLHTLDQMMDLDVICVDKRIDPRIDDWTPVSNGDGRIRIRGNPHKTDLHSVYNLPIVRRHYGE